MGINYPLKKESFSPDSLGAFYTSITQFLGFLNYGDEYKVMGLAPYGKPTYLNSLRNFLLINANGRFSLNQKYIYWEKKISKNIEGSPYIYTNFSNNLEDLLGKKDYQGRLLNNVIKILREVFKIYTNQPFLIF